MNELKWLIVVLIIITFLCILIIFSKLTIYLNYYHHKDNDNLKIEFRLWFGLIRYHKNIPLIKVDNDSPSIVVKGEGESENDENVSRITPQKVINRIKNIHKIIDHVFQLNIIVKKFLKRISIKKFEWNSVIGVGDAVHTGMATGAIWTIKGSVVSLLSHYLRMKVMPNLMVQPNFQQMITSTELSCMFQFRIGYAILAGLKLVKWWRGSLPHFNEMETTEKSL